MPKAFTVIALRCFDGTLNPALNALYRLIRSLPKILDLAKIQVWLKFGSDPNGASKDIVH